MRRFWFLLFVGLGMLAGATAHAQSGNCGPSLGLYDYLEEKFGEHRVTMGTTAKRIGPWTLEVAVEIWANFETGTWTQIETAQGISCMVGGGQNYILDEAEVEPEPTGDPT